MGISRRLASGVAIGTLAATAVAADLMAALPKGRTIALTNIHTKETLTIQYVKDGKRIPAAMEKINWVLRDWRKDEPAEMDPDLIDLLWEIHAELGSAEPIHVISGYRSRSTNDLLRKTVGGQASESRHILGKAADVYFPDVPVKKLRYSALLRERGGVGYYPTSATPFVHIDTDRVRSWPRLPRVELALLFPGGTSKHLPVDGTPITGEDVKIARSKHQDLAVQLAAFHGERGDTARASVIAAATPPPATPKPAPAVMALAPPVTAPVTAPAVVDPPSKLARRPSDADRSKLAELAASAGLASLEPELVRTPQPAVRRPAGPTLPSLTGTTTSPLLPVAGPAPTPRVAAVDPGAPAASARSLTDAAPQSSWVPAPAWDEEHPEELSYRPFPIAPYLTATASADDAALVTLVHPDVAKTLELLDQAGHMPPMVLLPGQQVARVLWAQQFTGAAVNANVFAPPGGGAIAGRKVRTGASE